MERYVCIHAHFYQPPRENPWLEAIEIQDSAYPYHDWNERITAECYAPNSASRVLDGDGRILDIVSNYAKISFNFGPTVLSWMEEFTPDVYQAILEADRLSLEWRSGHGSALAQVYNHIIMPLASERDKRTQVIWGIRDFEHRFKRFPEGMWLAETAADNGTLEILAEQGIRFTILAPHQAWRTRRIGAGKWKDVGGGRIDPTRPYVCKLPSGKKITIFFYDGPISQAVAFEKLLKSGDGFANRLLSGFSDQRQWPQILNIATDGETYGHHHRFGDMALAYALNCIESNGLARLTNYGEYLEKHPPTHEVQIFENSSWSCAHGVERWRSNCGCNSGGHGGWNQEWRGPLREALDWLREQISFRFEHKAREFLKNPWKARDEYIELILDRGKERVSTFLKRHSARGLSDEEVQNVLRLLEMQRQGMLMYTSCGWFFDELSGLETVQIIQYAGRAIQLCEEVFEDTIENSFLVRLAKAKSNIDEHGNGSIIYGKFVKPAIIDLKKVAAHFAVSSLFEDYAESTSIYSYSVRVEDYSRRRAGRTSLAVGRVSITSKVTRESEVISFCVLHLGNHALNGGVRSYRGYESYQEMKGEITGTFEKGAFADIIRLMDHHFGMHNYSLVHLFKDEQRKILNLLIEQTLEEFVDIYRGIYENNRILMGFLRDEARMPVPKAFLSAAEFVLNYDVEKAFSEKTIDADRVQSLVSEVKRWGTAVDSQAVEFLARHKFERMMEDLARNPGDFQFLLEIEKVLESLKLMPVEINYWHMQNIYFRMAKTAFREMAGKAAEGDEKACHWIGTFKYLGELLFFNIASILPEECGGGR